MVDQLSKQLQWFVNYSKSLTFQHYIKLKINFKCIQFLGEHNNQNETFLLIFKLYAGK